MNGSAGGGSIDMRVRDHVDLVQRLLQDIATPGADGFIWSRAELIAYLGEGYRQLLSTTGATRRWSVLPVPPLSPITTTHSWEQAFVPGGGGESWTFESDGGWSAAHLWELEQLEGLTPTAAGDSAMTHQWERYAVNPVHTHFRFTLPQDHQRIVRMWYDHKLLVPTDIRALDALETDWYSLGGEPLGWVRGTGSSHTVEVYEIVTAYQHGYRHVEAVTGEGNPLHGITRRLAGSRGYAWISTGDEAIPYGMVRRISSPERQYWPCVEGLLGPQAGRAAWWQSSANNLLILEALMPDGHLLEEEDLLPLLPQQLGKYLRAYVLARAFSRQGEGYNPLMAAFFDQWYLRGQALMRMLHQLTRHDRRMVRQVVTHGAGRPPRVRLPSTYPSPWA